MNKIKSLHTCHEGIEGVFKSPALAVSVEPNTLRPVAYLRKPANLTEEQFREVVRDVFSQVKGLSEHTVSLLEEEQK